MKKLLRIGLLGFCFVGLLVGSAEAEMTKVKLVLDWAVIGTHAPFSVALKNGLFEKNGLDVRIDRGYGSTDAISKVGNGTYDFGFADPNLLLQYNAKNPDAKVTMVFLLHDESQSAIVARKASGISSPKDLVGKKIAGAVGDNSRMLFPVYARLAGFDDSKVEWMTVQPQMKDTLLSRGDVDAVATLEPTTLLALKKFGASTDDYVSFRYSKFMPELMGTGIIVSERTIRERPEVIRAFVASTVEGMKYALAHPKEAVATLTALDPMVSLDNELARFKLGNDMAMSNPALKVSGMGAVTPERLRKSIEYISTVANVTPPADFKEIYNQDFLPAKADRMF
jgi:NitT/TauT family transport system substrate-binding protein